MGFDRIGILLLVMMIALSVALVLRRFKVPVIVSFVLVGMLVGPHVLGWLANTAAIRQLADFGVVLLMFTVGLEFSLNKLWSMRHTVFVLGGLQVLGCIVATALLGYWLGMPMISAFLMGSVVAMSSTAIVIKQMVDLNELNTQYGNNAVSILLFQDLAVIPILVFISTATSPSEPLLVSLAWSFIKGLIAMTAILGIGRWLLQPLFRWLSKTDVAELFTMIVLFVALASAWLTHALNLSYALGAFLAGIMLAECELRPKIKAEIRPFRDLLLGLFFITIGMLVNLAAWPDTWQWIVLLSVGLMLGKSLYIMLLGKLFRMDNMTAVRTGIMLAQGSEFGFAILSLSVAHQLMPTDWGQAALAALLISFLVSPLLNRFNGEIARWFIPVKRNSNHH